MHGLLSSIPASACEITARVVVGIVRRPVAGRSNRAGGRSIELLYAPAFGTIIRAFM